jgi:replicative DNA helicase
MFGKKQVDRAERLQPQSIELEEAVLGALMLERDAYISISEILTTSKSFYDNRHRLIFTAIKNLAIQQKPIDILTVVDQMRKEGSLEEAGGAYYIAKLSQKVVSTAHLEYHARIVAQKYIARELIYYAAQVTNKAFDETNDVDDVMRDADDELSKIVNNCRADNISEISVLGKKFLHRLETNSFCGISSGFKDLDKITLGWQNSDLIIIAGRPAMGKTAFILSMAKKMAIDSKISTGIFSLEMSNIQLITRLIINVTEVSNEKIRTGMLSPDEMDKLRQAVNNFQNMPLYINDTSPTSIFDIQFKAMQMVKKYNIKCIIIDYLQLITCGNKEYKSREREVSFISSALKSLAKKLNIPVIVLAQLNRGVDIRILKKIDNDMRRPQLADLRESGAIEQDADIVCLIHRPEYYKICEDEKGNNLTGKAEIIVAKHRNGSTGKVLLEFKSKFIKFQNVDEQQLDIEYESEKDNMPF